MGITLSARIGVVAVLTVLSIDFVAQAQQAPGVRSSTERAGESQAPAGATEHTFAQLVSVPIAGTEPVGLGTAKAAPTEGAATTNTGPQARQAQVDWRTLTFNSGVFTPLSGLDERIESSLPALRAAGRQFVYGFISLNVFLTETIRGQLAHRGITLLGPHDTMHKARLPADAAVLAAVVDLPHVEWIGFSTIVRHP